ncbi:sugar-binding transcriptional regulator [Aurantimonas sp. Leaf443]|uniref:sugar-binding transcriptional regulator n=1 Tax=Aurantimonas sp. Leaf443 TaxID=1736378 RepID=UPI0006F3AA48|nr:sugar-binding transcriptional regulator [Aurantimonas sp. Leaf443]KQT86152.1 DNA-binding transcriptional regulator [Aurantimonas sp. Leaf443]
MAKGGSRRETDDSLAIRAAWLHYAAGMTQVEVAERLGVSSVKAHRLIASAYQNGAVKVSIVGDVAECVALESVIADRFGLSYCEVVPDLHEDGLPLRALGGSGAAFLCREIESAKGGIIGFGHGRTLAAAIAAMPRIEAGAVRFVSLLGGLTRNYMANPHDVMHRLAERTQASAFVMPLPFFANTVGDKAVLLAQRGVGEVFDLATRADLMVVGIGTAQLDAQLVASRMIYGEEIEEVRQGGGVGEMLGHFFDAAGQPVETSLTARTVSPGLDQLKGKRIVALAGGRSKVEGIRSVLRSGFLTGLITDERTANAIMGGETP